MGDKSLLILPYSMKLCFFEEPVTIVLMVRNNQISMCSFIGEGYSGVVSTVDGVTCPGYAIIEVMDGVTLT